jgi:hypothetical protein
MAGFGQEVESFVFELNRISTHLRRMSHLAHAREVFDVELAGAEPWKPQLI